LRHDGQPFAINNVGKKMSIIFETNPLIFKHALFSQTSSKCRAINEVEAPGDANRSQKQLIKPEFADSFQLERRPLSEKRADQSIGASQLKSVESNSARVFALPSENDD
jgi:hypothetical protein